MATLYNRDWPSVANGEYTSAAEESETMSYWRLHYLDIAN